MTRKRMFYARELVLQIFLPSHHLPSHAPDPDPYRLICGFPLTAGTILRKKTSLRDILIRLLSVTTTGREKLVPYCSHRVISLVLGSMIRDQPHPQQEKPRNQPAGREINKANSLQTGGSGSAGEKRRAGGDAFDSCRR